MQIRLLLPTSLAILAATAAPVLAGQCTEEINALSEELDLPPWTGPVGMLVQ